MKRTIVALLGMTFALAGLTAHADDLAAGQAVFKKFNCASCHGADAKTPLDNSYPVLAGQYQDYLVHALTAYRRGAADAPVSANYRKNPIMGAFAAQLSDEDIQNVADWLSSLPSGLTNNRH